MRNSFFLNRKDYKFRPFTDGGLSGNKQFAIPKQGDGVAYVIKGGSRECACNEFIGLRLAKLMGVNVPWAYLVSPKEGDYAVAIEYLISCLLYTSSPRTAPASRRYGGSSPASSLR